MDFEFILMRKAYRQRLVLEFTKKRIVSQIALIAGEILFIFSLKMKRLYRKAGIAFTENALCFASEKKRRFNFF